MTIKVGIDAGNNGTKIWVEGKAPYMIPAVYSQHLGDLVSAMDQPDVSSSKIKENLDLTISSPAITFSNTRYIVGQKVLDDKLEAIEMEKKSNKAKDDVPLITALSGLAVDAIERNPGKSKIKESYDIGVALPITSISPTVASEYEKRYIGSHKVVFNQPNGSTIEVQIDIEFCKCLPEGASAAWGVVYDESGQLIERTVSIQDEETLITYEDKTLLHFDIGAGTSEIVVTQGVGFKPKLSEGRGYGTKQTVLEIIKHWNVTNERKTIDSIIEFNEIYFNPEHPRHSTLKPFSQQFIRQLAIRFSKEIINKIDEMKDDPFVFIYGGGAALIKDDLERLLESSNHLQNVVFLKNPMFVNARGLLVYVSSPRYAELKERSLGVGINA